MSIFLSHYKNNIVPLLMKEFNYKSIMQVPTIKKITLNIGVGESITDKNFLEKIDELKFFVYFRKKLPAYWNFFERIYDFFLKKKWKYFLKKLWKFFWKNWEIFIWKN